MDSAPAGAVVWETAWILDEMQDYDLSAAYVPNFLEGTLTDNSVKRVAVVVGGVVVDVVEPLFDRGRLRFSSLFDPDFLKEGPNQLGLYSISSTAPGAEKFSPIGIRALPVHCG